MRGLAKAAFGTQFKRHALHRCKAASSPKRTGHVKYWTSAYAKRTYGQHLLSRMVPNSKNNSLKPEEQHKQDQGC